LPGIGPSQGGAGRIAGRSRLRDGLGQRLGTGGQAEGGSRPHGVPDQHDRELEAGVTPVAEAYRRAAAQGRPVNYGFATSSALARMEAVAGLAPEASLRVHCAPARAEPGAPAGRPGFL